MKKLFILAMCLVSTMFAMAQKETIEFYNLSYNGGQIYEQEAATLKENLIAAFNETGRLNIVPVNQKELKSGSKAKNKYALIGTVTAFSVTSKWNNTGSRYEYTGNVKYDVRLYDLQTGQMIDQISCDAIGVSTTGNEDARARAIANTEKNKIKVFVEKNFPIVGEIIAIASGDAKKAKTVYINLGTDAGVKKGQEFKVFQLVDIAGEMSEKEIGTLKVTNVLSGGRSECKVDKGGDLVNTAVNKGDQLIIKSKPDAASSLGGWLGL